MSTFIPSKRVEWTEDLALDPLNMEIGTYAKTPGGAWWLMPPADGPIHMDPVNDSGWAYIEHEDGQLEIGPVKEGAAHSIWINKPNGWHGFLRKGQWETV